MPSTPRFLQEPDAGDLQRRTLHGVLQEWGLVARITFLEWPHYFDIVRYHIDVAMIREKIDKGVYYCAQDFVSDIELMWSNALNYFSPSEELYSTSSRIV